MRDRWARKVIEGECNITTMVGAEGTAVAGRRKVESVKPADGPGSGNGGALGAYTFLDRLVEDDSYPGDEFVITIVMNTLKSGLTPDSTDFVVPKPS